MCNERPGPQARRHLARQEAAELDVAALIRVLHFLPSPALLDVASAALTVVSGRHVDAEPAREQFYAANRALNEVQFIRRCNAADEESVRVR